MPRMRQNEFDEEIDSHFVHSEPMQATLGEKIGEIEDLRVQIVDAQQSESVLTSRARFKRSLRALNETLRHSMREVGTALRGSIACAAAWARAEIRDLSTKTRRADHGNEAVQN